MSDILTLNPNGYQFFVSDSSKVYFTSDTHLFHKSILEKYTARPWASLDEMHDVLRANWNAIVPEDGIVFHLGDLSWRFNLALIEFIQSLNGKIILLAGNHDARDIVWIRSRLADKVDVYAPYAEAYIKDEDGSVQEIMLCHYSIRVWNRAHYGSWHLYGHTHGTIESVPWGKSFDVGVDSPVANYAPIPYSTVKALMSTREIASIKGDHHGKRVAS